MWPGRFAPVLPGLGRAGAPRLGPAALRILGLADDLAAERALTARLHERLAGQGRQDEG